MGHIALYLLKKTLILHFTFVEINTNLLSDVS